ncbi:MAG TPA: helix-hairpin-helix domain-containing protein [Prolixibacteraceae bacterium]|nr:helix-hairpin-helix domain-containing protein [Prolixibacteraceae bacterium]
MRLRHFLDELLFMSKAQRNASFVLVVMLVIVLLIRVLSPFFIKDEDFSEEIRHKIELLEKAEFRSDSISKSQENSKQNFNKFKPFHFDPNAISYSGLLKLGFNPKTATIFINYRESGAVFHDPEDLKKVYGVDSLLFAHLKDFVRIPRQHVEEDEEKDKKEQPGFEKVETQNEIKSRYHKPKAINVIDLNTADTTSLKLLHGIGPVFAARICNFRDYLGGFYHVEQLREVYNLSEETYKAVLPYVSVDTNHIKKININFCSVAELKKHPYCDYNQAREVVNYRARHGEYNRISDLSSDSVLSIFDFNRLSPYLTVKVEHPKAMK